MPGKMTVRQLELLAKESGLELRVCTQTHIRIIGGVVPVNIYIGDAHWTMYVDGMAAGRKLHSIREAIAAATKVPGSHLSSRKVKRKNNVAMRKRLWQAGKKNGGTPKCHWCGEEFRNQRDATLDHVIPLSKGGSNGANNCVLACNGCNSRRGNTVTESDVKSITAAERMRLGQKKLYGPCCLFDLVESKAQAIRDDNETAIKQAGVEGYDSGVEGLPPELNPYSEIDHTLSTAWKIGYAEGWRESHRTENPL